MQKILLALLEQEYYSRCFADYISQKKNKYLNMRIFTSFEKVIEFLEHGCIDVLLIGEEMLDKVTSKDKINRIIVLSDGEFVKEISEYPVVFKYQSVEVIIKEVMSQLADDDNINAAPVICRSVNKEFIGVYSPFGGAGASSYAQSMAAKMNNSRKTLYVNLELLNGMPVTDHYVKESELYIRGMSEVIYYIKQRKDKLSLKIQSLIYKTGETDCIYPVEDYRDLYNLTSEDSKKFIDVLTNETEYEIIVFDIGYIGEGSLEIMQSCEKLIFPEALTETQKRKQYSFERLIEKAGYLDIKRNIQFVKMERCD